MCSVVAAKGIVCKAGIEFNTSHIVMTKLTIHTLPELIMSYALHYCS